MVAPRRYYDLESYLFEDVRANFHANGALTAFEFFSIVIWKANRAKSRIAKRLLSKRLLSDESLTDIVTRLTRELNAAQDNRARLRVLMFDWGFKLPMASALLTVLWPDEFTVYDVRACGQLQAFETLGNLTYSDRLGDLYADFVAAVRTIADQRQMSLRDADRSLWGESARNQLQADIENSFGHKAFGS